jgi:hypothetical protein
MIQWSINDEAIVMLSVLNHQHQQHPVNSQFQRQFQNTAVSQPLIGFNQFHQTPPFRMSSNNQSWDGFYKENGDDFQQNFPDDTEQENDNRTFQHWQNTQAALPTAGRYNNGPQDTVEDIYNGYNNGSSVWEAGVAPEQADIRVNFGAMGGPALSGAILGPLVAQTANQAQGMVATHKVRVKTLRQKP